MHVLQGVKHTSVHDIMEDPWPNGMGIQAFEQLLEDAKSTGRLRSLTVTKVITKTQKFSKNFVYPPVFFKWQGIAAIGHIDSMLLQFSLHDAEHLCKFVQKKHGPGL